MKSVEECTVGIVGLGLMGGAIAMALRKCGAASAGRLLACDKDEETLIAALAQGVIDEGFDSPKEMLGRCDIVFLCLNPSTLIRFLDQWMDAFRPGALVTDIAGIKGNIVKAVEEKLKDGIDFIPGHPMAGAERGGFENAKACNFHGKNYILTPLERNKPENLEYLRNLIYRMGFGRVSLVSPREHDRKIAFTSQLCHVIAAALIDCEPDTEITRFGGGSFEDLTRIAMLNAPMWTELFIENREELLRRIEQFEGSLDKLKAMIAGDRGEALMGTLSLVREKRIKMKG
jgi:prephenate dehydrogenase